MLLRLRRFSSVMLFLMALSVPALPQSSDAQKRLRLFTVRGWTYSISFRVIAPLERALKEDPEHLRIQKIEYERLPYSGAHYLLRIPQGLKKEHLPALDSTTPIIKEEIEVLEDSWSFLLTNGKIYYPLFEKLLKYSQDRSNSLSYQPELHLQRARLESFRSTIGEELPMVTIGGLQPTTGWTETIAAHYYLEIDGKPVRVTVIGKPQGALSRVKPALERRMRDVREPALLLHLGAVGISKEFGVAQDIVLKPILDAGAKLVAFETNDIEYD